MADVSEMSDSELLAHYAMPSLKTQESGNRPGVLGPQTRYGRAEGMTQMLPATAKATAEKLGLPWRPELMRGTTEEAAQYQEDLGRAYLQEGIEKTGNLQDGLRYYHGGPDRKLWGPKTEAYAGQVASRLSGAPSSEAAPDLAGLSDDELIAMYQGGAPQRISTSKSGGVTVDRIPQRPVTTAPTAIPQRVDQTLGFAKGLGHTGDRGAQGLEWLAGRVGLDKPINALGEALGLPSTDEAATSREAFLAAQKAKGIAPGKIGEFAGNVAGTAWVPGGPLVQGAIGGLLTGDSTDAAGLAKDATIGAVTGRLAAGASDALQVGARKALSKVPQIMDLPALKAARKAAYDAVDNSGFVFPKDKVAGLVDDFNKAMSGMALSATAKKDAASIVAYARTLAKGDVSLSQLEKLRGDIYEALSKKGGDTSVIGGKFRSTIDDLMGSVDDSLVKKARELNARFKKTDYVDRMSKSADRAAERTYGGDYGRKVKDRLNPLVDEAMPKRNLRGATPDEKAALEKVIRGTKGQNLASTVGGMLDPRRLGGKLLTGTLGGMSGTAGVMTGGTSLPLTLALQAGQLGAGFGLTGIASKTARKNVEDLIRLMAAGGSKQAVVRVPTKASQAAEEAISKVLRPALVASAVPGLAAARPPQKPKPKR